MSERVGQLQVLVLKEWLSFMYDDSEDVARRSNPFDTKIVARNTLNHIARVEAELKKAKVDSKRLGDLKEWLVDQKESLHEGNSEFTDGERFGYTQTFNQLFKEEPRP